jgi:hypothetical protein
VYDLLGYTASACQALPVLRELCLQHVAAAANNSINGSATAEVLRQCIHGQPGLTCSF